MSKKQQDHSRITGLAAGYRVFIPGVFPIAPVTAPAMNRPAFARTPSVAAKLRLMARHAALAGLAVRAISFANRCDGCDLVEPIGIEPMTPCLQSRCSPS